MGRQGFFAALILLIAAGGGMGIAPEHAWASPAGDGLRTAARPDPMTDPIKRRHWSFQPPRRPPEPAVANGAWPHNAIDRFVLARMEAEGLSPSPRADRVTLIRRLSLDLIGLPPTLEEVDEFVADASPDAYEKLVERLLASPHYGERWGRHWLDAARYADTNGYEKDLPRSIWPYRDWVIQAFNRDLPFDQFAVDQIAGDLLPDAALEQKVATGFLRNSMLNEEGGVDPEQFRVEGIIDRVDAIGKAFLGLTINCAQCHNHKFDPISQREYYRFFAFLNSDDEPAIEVPTHEQQQARSAILKQVSQVEDELWARHSDSSARLDEWAAGLKTNVNTWTVLDPTDFFGAVGTKFTKLKDHSLLATASSPPVSGYTITVKTPLRGITGFRLEAMTDPNLPSFGPGRAKTGNFVLTEITVDAAPLDQPNRTNRITLVRATADFSQKDFPVSAAIDGVTTNKTGWAVDGGPGPGRRNVDRKAVFQAEHPIDYPGGAVLTFHLEQLQGQELTLGRLRLSATTDPNPAADPLPQRLRNLINSSAARTAAENRELFSFYRTTQPEFASANARIDELFQKWPAAPATLVLAQREEPRETHIFKRGDFRKPEEAVTPGVPSILNPLPPDTPPTRLTLAKWLVDPKNPLVARVIMNRVWQAYFGRGIVTTAEDFGTQGSPPSHPELLDWLATEFLRQGWSLKAMHRLIVESATYQQSSVATPEKLEKDAYNRWLSRGPRVRVEAEIIRDIALSASGLLSERVGGPSVYPPIPDGVLSLGYGSPMPWPTETGANRYRRGIYTFWKRSVPYPSLLVFDAPNADFACVRRVVSDTPLQALTTLNDTVFVEAAQAMGLRILKDGGPTDLEKAIFAFRLCTARKPDAAELQQILGLLGEEKNYFENRTAAAVKVSAPDPKNPPEDVNLHQVAAWTLVARVLLNMDETITKE